MGKASKRVKRQVQKKADVRKQQQCRPLEAELDTAFIVEDYTKVLEILAELIKAQDIKADFLYKGAYSYFMLGDFDRAAQWVNNTLNYDAHNVDARILLARICFIQNRHDDGLALYDFLVSNYSQTMNQEQKDQIRDSSEYYTLREADNMREKYPHLAAFLNLDQGEVPAKISSVVTATTEKKSHGSVAVEGNTLSALQRLKTKLQTVHMRNQQESTGTVSEIEQMDQITGVNVSKQIADIQNKTCSFREKIQLCNTFAAAQYMVGDYVGAEAYLKAALQFDDGDVKTLRNMAMVQIALEDYVKAQTLVSKLPEVDFVLLYILKEQAEQK